ncbi:MAG: MarR family transcriptional regulator [Actinomycetota bacterium]|nr:MarR family transcriptional regulator [Actinomycetota bacterium]
MTSVRGVGKDLRRPGLLAWLRLARVFQKVERDSGEHLRAWDLNVAQFDVLAQVGAVEGIVQQELADSLLVTKGNVCQLLDRLEGRGLILRRREGRTNRLFLTDEGRRLFDEVVPAHETLVAERFSVLSPKEQAQLHELLRNLDKALG